MWVRVGAGLSELMEHEGAPKSRAGGLREKRQDEGELCGEGEAVKKRAWAVTGWPWGCDGQDREAGQ